MKKLTILLLLVLSTTLFSDELSWVDEQVEAIKPPRHGILRRDISKLKDPFIFLSAKKVYKKKSSYKRYKRISKRISKRVSSYLSNIKLDAIMNKSAFINAKWYKEGEKVSGYTLEKVGPKSVLLTKGKKRILLSTLSKSKNLKFNNE